jgi:hypothetical protein
VRTDCGEVAVAAAAGGTDMVLDPELFEHDVGSRVVSRFSQGAQLPLDVRIGSMPGAANTLPALEAQAEI